MIFFRLSFLIVLLFNLVSCSTYEPFVPPADFDASTYVDPEPHGGELAFKMDPSKPYSTNSSFTPITIKGGFKQAVSSNSFRPNLAHSRGGGATIRIYVDSTGTLTQIERIKVTNTSIARELEELATQNQFNPAVLNGKPVNSYRQMEMYLASQTRSVRRQL